MEKRWCEYSNLSGIKQRHLFHIIGFILLNTFGCSCCPPAKKHIQELGSVLFNILNLSLNQQVMPNGLHFFRNEISAKIKRSIYFIFYQSINDTLRYDVNKEFSNSCTTLEYIEQYLNKFLLHIFLLFENYFVIITVLATAS